MAIETRIRQGRGSPGSRAGMVSLGAGLVVLLAGALGAALDARGFMAAWLTAWWFWAGLLLGAQGTLWMHRLTGGRWIGPIAAPMNRLRAAVPALLALVLPVLIWPGLLYPWARPDWVDTATETAFRHAWFTPAGMALRVIVCIVVWSVLARIDGAGRAASRRAGYAAAGLLLYAFTISLVAVDLLMSLTPEWYSTAFGFVILAAQLKAAMAVAARDGAPRATGPLRGDLGNLLLMYVLTWAYLAFTQFQIIWAENLPAEISWYVPRLHGAWEALGVVLVVAGFAIPLPALLSRAFKRSIMGLRALAILLLAVSVCEAAWWVLPSVAPATAATAPGSTGPSIGAISWHTAWMLLLDLAGMGLILRATAILFPTILSLPSGQEEDAEGEPVMVRGQEQGQRQGHGQPQGGEHA